MRERAQPAAARAIAECAWAKTVLVFAVIAIGGGCGDATAPTADTTIVDTTPVGGPFSVSIVPSVPGGNAPLDVTFAVQVTEPEGAPDDWLSGVSYAWTVDGNPAGEGDRFDFSFYRAGASTISVTARSRSDGETATDTTTIDVRGCADLAFDGFVVAQPTDVVPGGTLTVGSGSLINIGDAVIGDVAVAIGLSATEFWDPDSGYLSETRTFDGIPSGLVTDATIDLAGLDFAIAEDVPAGTYAAFLVADPVGSVNECQESNNARIGVGSVTVDPDANLKPDLRVPNVSVADGLVLAQGQDLNYAFTFENAGDADSRQFRFEVWLSRDPTLSPDDDVRIVAASEQTSRVQNLPESSSLGFARVYRTPDDLEDGQWWVIVVVDATGIAFEHDETNNVGVSAVPFTMRYEEPSCYDLDVRQAGALTLDTTTSFWGGSVRATVRVHNGGTVPTPAGWTLRAYLSQQASLNPATARLAGSATGGVIAPGASETLEMIVPITSDYPVFPHYLGVWVDPVGIFDECEEGNNNNIFGTPVQIEAVARVDLAASALVHHPSTVAAGDTFRAEFRVSNLGTTATTAFRASLALSGVNVFTADAFADGRAVLVDRVTIPALAAGDSVDLIRDVVVPSALDHSIETWSLAAIADLEKLIGADTNLANNLYRSPVQVVVTGASGGCFEDDAEPNDVAIDAEVLAPGAHGGLGLCGNADWYAFAVGEAQTVRVTVEALPIVSAPALPNHLTVELFDPDGVSVGQTTLGSPYEVTDFLAPVGGLYTLRVGGATALDRASYGLTVALDAPSSGVDIAAANLTFDTSAAYPGGRLALRFDEANLGDRPAPAYVHTVRLERLDASAEVSLGSFAAEPLGPRTRRQADLLVDLPTALEGGAWRLVVEADPTSIDGEAYPANNRVAVSPVVIDVARTCLSDRYEPNDSAAFATPSTAATTAQRFSGAIVCPGGVDWYRVDLPPDRSLRAELSQAYDPARGRATLEIVDPAGVASLASATVSDSGFVSLPHNWLDGPHYVRVTHANATTGLPITYELTLSTTTSAQAARCDGDAREPDNALATAVPLGCAPVDATLCRGDVDYFRVEVTAGAQLSMGLNHPNASLRATLMSVDGATTYIQRQGNGTSTYTPAVTGSMVVKVESRVATSGLTAYPYTLTVGGLVAADVAALELHTESDRVDAGEELGVSFDLVNACTRPTDGFRTDVLLSTDMRPGPEDVLLARFELPNGLATGEVFSFDDKLLLPASTPPGDYFLITVADATDGVDEPDERNNIETTPLRVRAPCVPDRHEINDSVDAATAIELGTHDGLSVCAGDLDWFVVDVPPGGGTFVADMWFSHDEGDLDLRVYDAARGFTVPVATSASRDDDEGVSLDVPLATTLYVRVNGYLGARAAYGLQVDVVPSP